MTDYTCASAHGPGRRHFDDVGPAARRVHLSGSPADWAVEEILRRAPGLEELQLPPVQGHVLSQRARQLLAARGVRVTFGRLVRRTHTAGWARRREDHRRFFLGLDGDRRAALDEVLALDVKWPKMVARYLCLGGEDRVTADVILAANGFSPRIRNALSSWCAAVRGYLDPDFAIGEEAARHLRGLRWQIDHVRREGHRSTIEAAWAETFQALGVAGPPPGLQRHLLPAFATVVEADRDGRLGALARQNPRQARVLRLHYGLEDGRRHTLEEIAKTIGGVTRERARQIEVEALAALQDDRPPPKFSLPRGLPRRLEGTYEIVASARGDGRLSSLSDEQADVVRLHYGLDDGQFRTCREVAAILGVSCATVCYHERNAIERLRESCP